MILQVYTIKDALTGYKENFFTASCEQEAIRFFKTAANQEGSYIKTFAEDIDLYRIGTFDTQSGKLEQSDAGPTFCMRAKNALETEV